MNPSQAITSCLKKYAVFSGRASRSEYWYWMLFHVLVHIVTRILDAIIYPASAATHVSNAFDLIVLLPSLAVAVRRLHDVDRSGWWLLMDLIIIGMIYPLLVWKCRRGTEGPNRFGEDSSGMDLVVSQFD
jgi:uncharacterized membrane protein YhaH (DUF805 family)